MMEGGTIEKGAMDGGSSTQGYLKVSPNYHHQSQHHERDPSIDNNIHHDMHQQQHHHAKPPLPAHQHQQYYPKAHGHYGRSEGNNARGEYPSYPPPPNQYHPSHPSHYIPHLRPGVRSVVTHSFSMEEEQREDGSSRYGNGHHRGQSQQDTGGYLRDEYRSPPAEFHSDRSSDQHQQRERSFELQPPMGPPHFNNRRDYQYGNGRELPPVLEGSESHLPPHGLIHRSGEHNPLERVPSSNQEETQVSSIERSLSSVSAGGPLKRSFWHHSRPDQASNANEEYGNDGQMSQSSSLPQEFMPPKRSKTSPSESGGSAGSPKREYIVTARSQASTGNQQQLEIARANSDVGSLSGIRTSPGAALSPRDAWFNRSNSMSWEAREDYYRRDPRLTPSWSSRSPNGRDGPAPMASGSGPHWMGAPYMPSPRSRHANEGSHYDPPLPPPWEMSPRDWGQHQPPHHQQPYSAHLPYPSWLAGSNGKGGDLRQRDQNSENKFLRQGQDHGGFGIDQQHPGIHFTNRSAPPLPHVMSNLMGSPMQASSGAEPLSMMNGQSRERSEGDGMGLNKNETVKLLALPEDRISLSETLCIVREVSTIIVLLCVCPLVRLQSI